MVNYAGFKIGIVDNFIEDDKDSSSEEFDEENTNLAEYLEKKRLKSFGIGYNDVKDYVKLNKATLDNLDNPDAHIPVLFDADGNRIPKQRSEIELTSENFLEFLKTDKRFHFKQLDRLTDAENEI